MSDSNRPDHRAMTVTQPECAAWRILATKGEYTHRELAFMFEVNDTTVTRHVNGDCPHE